MKWTIAAVLMLVGCGPGAAKPAADPAPSSRQEAYRPAPAEDQSASPSPPEKVEPESAQAPPAKRGEEGVEGGVEEGVEGGVEGGVLDGARQSPPPPPAPPAVAPSVVPMAALHRTAGLTEIPPGDQVLSSMHTRGIRKLMAVLKLCIDDQGLPSSVTLLRSSGFPSYDQLLEAALRNWRFEPFHINGRAKPVCASATLVFAPKN